MRASCTVLSYSLIPCLVLFPPTLSYISMSCYSTSSYLSCHIPPHTTSWPLLLVGFISHHARRDCGIFSPSCTALYSHPLLLIHPLPSYPVPHILCALTLPIPQPAPSNILHRPSCSSTLRNARLCCSARRVNQESRPQGQWPPWTGVERERGCTTGPGQ